jgi:MFS family permease
MRLFAALRHRSFLLLWLGQMLSRIGDQLYLVALTWWVLKETGSAIAMATVLTLSIAPTLALLLLGGVAVDRLPRVRIVFLCDLVRGVLMCGLGVLASQGRLVLGHVYVASLLFGAADALFQPAHTAAVPQLVPVDALASANALSSFGGQIGRIVGPPLGAALTAYRGPAAAFGFNGVSFFLSAALVLPLVRGERAPENSAAPGESHVARELREGFAAILQSPWLGTTIVVMGLSNAALAGAYTVALPFVIKGNLHEGVGTLGFLYAMFAVGYLLGGVWISRSPKLASRGVKAYVALGLGGLGIFLMGLPLPVPVLALAALLNGASLEVFGVIWITSLQKLVPADKLGRAASFDAFGSLCLLPLGYAAASWGTKGIGAAATCALCGAATILLAALGLGRRAVRSFD